MFFIYQSKKTEIQGVCRSKVKGTDSRSHPVYILYPGYRHRYRHLEFTPVNIGISQMDQSIGESILGRWINPWAKSGNIFSYLVSEDFWLIHV